ncbi:MAG: lysophospholipid acyltransferase family protein [Sphingopyxis sp.]
MTFAPSTAIAAVRTIIWAPIFAVGSAFLVILSGIAALISRDKFIRAVHYWGGWNHVCARLFLGQRVVIDGVIPSGGVFLLFKHEAMFETIDMPYLLRRPVVFAKQELFSIPLWGRLAKLYGLIPIERSAGASAMRAMRKAARDAIADDRPVVLFPEGTRVPHGQMPPLRSGFAGVYKLIGLPVIPVAVDSGRLIRGWIRYPGTVTYRVGPTIPPGLPRDEAEALAHAALNALNTNPATN